MSCCGQKRTAIARTASPKAETRRAPALRRVVLQYLGSARVTYIGAVTKRLYSFAATGANVTVDARDAGGLVALGLFRWVA
jgi:hypothetical protein